MTVTCASHDSARMTTSEVMRALGVNRVFVLRLVERGALAPAVIGARGRASYEFERPEVARVAALLDTLHSTRAALGLSA